MHNSLLLNRVTPYREKIYMTLSAYIEARALRPRPRTGALMHPAQSQPAPLSFQTAQVLELNPRPLMVTAISYQRSL